MPTIVRNGTKLAFEGRGAGKPIFVFIRGRTLAKPKTAQPWSPTSQRERLIKIGAKVVSHRRHGPVPDGQGRDAATVVRRDLVADRPAARSARAGMSDAGASCGKRRQERCASVGSKSALSVWRPRPTASIALRRRQRRLAVAQADQRRDPALQNVRGLANVGLMYPLSWRSESSNE
jgi:hypothetical protein